MKHLSLVILLVGIVFGCVAESGYTVKTRISNPNHYTLLLVYQKGQNLIFDSTFKVENGWAIFKGKVEEPVIATLVVRGNPATMIISGNGVIPGPTLQFFLTNDLIQIEGDANSIYMASISGGKANSEWNKIRPKENELSKEDWLATKTFYENSSSDKDSAAIERVREIRQRNAIKRQDLRKEFINQNPKSVVSLFFYQLC